MSKIDHCVLVRHFDNQINKNFNQFNDFLMGLVNMKYDINGANAISLEQSIMLAQKLMDISRKYMAQKPDDKKNDQDNNENNESNQDLNN